MKKWTKNDWFKYKEKKDKEEYKWNHIEIAAAIKYAPLKKGVSESMLERKGSPCDDGYIDKLHKLLGSLNEQA